MSPFKDAFPPRSSDSPNIAEALSMLMKALQNEADVFIKILRLYTRGGETWQELVSTVERLHAASESTDKPGATPGDARPAPPTVTPREDIADSDEDLRHG
jgi:hypothetical protein